MDKWIFKILLLLAVGYLIWGQVVLPVETTRSESESSTFNDGWMWIKDNGEKTPVKVPGILPVKRGDTAVISRQLPESIRENIYLMYCSPRQDVWVLIDGKERSRYSTEKTRLFGTTSSSYYLQIELFPMDAGKEIRIGFSSDSGYTGDIRNIYIGDRLSLNRILMSEDIASMAVAMIMLIIGLGVVIICLILERAFRQHIPMENLGWGIVVLSAWSILGSSFRQFLFPNLSTASDVTFMMVMLIPFPFLIYMNQKQNGRYRILYIIMDALLLLDVLASLALVIGGGKDFSETIFMNIVFCFVSIGLIVVTLLLDMFNDKIREYVFPAIGVVGIGVSGGIQSYLYVSKVKTNLGSIPVSVGLLFMLVMAAIDTVRELMRMNRDKSNALQSSRSQSQFLASMSHEIRTPINAVLGMDEMILRESTQKEVLEYATDIQNAGKSLLTIINDILDFSKIDSGKMELVPVEYSLSGLIRDCCNMVALRAADKGLKMTVKNNPNLPEQLYGDEKRVRQIIVNFLTNAVKYTEKGEVTLVVDGFLSELTAAKETWNLKISVRDSGIGIKEQDIPYLFDAFRRMDAQKNRNVEGTGLGLALSNNLAKLMGGQIDVESVYGEGSTFVLIVPQKIIGRAKIGEFCMEDGLSHIAAPGQNQVYLPGARILVVDDVAVNLKVFTSLLKKSGMIIDTAESGEICLSKVREWKYDLIFLDHMMPVMNGMEVMKRIRQMEFGPNAETPVIMLTANAFLGAKETYLEAGFADYLSKPIQFEELEAVLLAYINREKYET